MLKKILAVIFLTLFAAPHVFADNIFDYPANAVDVAEKLPQLKSVSCKFTQEKTLKNKTLKSGGNFQFIKDKGVIFETLYPVKTTSSYTSSQNKQISDIIKGIASKDYSFINKNFNLFYMSENLNWTVALTPKKKSPAYDHIESIIIYGRDEINKLNINTTNGTNTSINFSCGI